MNRIAPVFCFTQEILKWKFNILQKLTYSSKKRNILTKNSPLMITIMLKLLISKVYERKVKEEIEKCLPKILGSTWVLRML